MSFPATCSKTKKARNILAGMFSCPTFQALVHNVEELSIDE
jgi:hypothetical protein